jgi:hypothetical protein
MIPASLTARTVRSYIDFDGHDATTSADEPSIQARLQSEGVAGLWSLMQQNGYAYLADEVGMGKTRQAMGVIATQFLSKPDSRIVIVCASASLQEQWQKEWSEFLSNCYSLLDDRLLSTDAVQLQELRRHNNLRQFVAALKDDDSRIHLLRYSSFSRPISVDRQSPVTLLKDYAAIVGVSDVSLLDEAEQAIAAQCDTRQKGWSDKMRHALAAQYCRRLATLLTDGSDAASKPDLVIFDEAQYLRHTDNWQNQHIRQIFRSNAQKWLFLSATPLHSGSGDIKGLDAYLDHEPVKAAPKEWDVVQLLQQMMIRRTRTYADHHNIRHGKIQYRRYDRVRYSGADDPFMAMTMALVQKRLVGALAGNANKFRQGECASFESLSSSVARIIGPATAAPELEPLKDRKQDETTSHALDRNVIDELNSSFVQAMENGSGYGLPHAKLNRMVDDLFDRSLANGSTQKTLVFVRRIDTVEEIRDMLHERFQQAIDARIECWRTLLSSPDVAGKLWKGSFWQDPAVGAEAEDPDPEDQPVKEVDEDEDELLLSGTVTHNQAYREQAELPYFEALKQRSETHHHNGKLVSFRSRLHAHVDLLHKPIRGFLHRRPAPVAGESPEKDDHAWQLNRQRWHRLLLAVLGQEQLSEEGNEWLLGDPTQETPLAYKLAALQLCLLQSMRQTDFVVDLFILQTHLDKTPAGETELADKLLWLLEQDAQKLPAALAQYVENQRLRFRHWIENFDLIVGKCFRSGTVDSWDQVWSKRIPEVFRPLAPAIGRSGRVRNKHAIPHFNLPCHPNILVCTDVLKEGVDMHLFCDRVVHYGVAWTSGDLEQRIGRVDRFGSLISRRIREHEVTAGQLPRLEVVFPYLEGTLDQHQVNRVIRAKITSDLRMDLGKRKDEIGDISVDALDEKEGAPPEPLKLTSGGAVFFPDSVRHVSDGGGDLVLLDGVMRKPKGLAVTARKPGDADAAETRQPLPAYGAVVVRRQAEQAHDVLRQVPSAGEPRWTEEFVMLRGASTSSSPAVLLADGGPHAVKQPPDAAFTFDVARNTCIWCAGVAPVLLETVGTDFWLLRCHVQHDSSTDLNGKRSNGNWLAERNRERAAGYLMEADGAVWFGTMVLRSAGAETLLNHIAARVHRIARNLRGPGNDPDENGYWARTAFPAALQPIWMNTMKKSDVVACGQVLTGVQAWFEEAFEAMLEALYVDTGANQRGLATQPLTFLPNGMLHLTTDGAERFRLQAGLDLAGTLEAPFAGPKMWWELVVTPYKKGTPPQLPISELDELPHANPNAWGGESRDGYAAFTSDDDRDYRYAAVYHAPQDWERARVALIDALTSVRFKMHELDTFRRKDQRDVLLNALT